jgi:death-on-curing protein
MEPVFLALDEVLELHAGVIDRHGGSPEIRDMGLLESALAVPRSGSLGVYFHADLHSMAAAYLFHIVKNHPFVDGNKRTGALAAFVFLRLNGLTLVCSSNALVRQVIAVAEGRSDKVTIARFFRRHARG